MNLEERARELCASPTGCAFLCNIEESGLPLDVAARPDIAIDAAAAALSDTDIWSPDHEALVALALAQGERLQDLARAILATPEAAWWFAPVDREAQWIVLKSGQDLSEDAPITPISPPTGWEIYAQKPANAIYTSTAVNGTCATLTAMAHLAVDYYPEPPLRPIHMRASAAARVYEVDGAWAWHELARRFPAHETRERKNGRLVPDWGQVAAEWDAVHLTLGGMLTADQVRIESEAGWTELESWPPEVTVWFRQVLEEVERLPLLDAPPPSGMTFGSPNCLWIRYETSPGPWLARVFVSGLPIPEDAPLDPGPLAEWHALTRDLKWPTEPPDR
ncbi:MAG: hypothetical protein U0031_23170 [Thermomicrobiales bacterium]